MHVELCWQVLGEGERLEVYIVVSEIFSKNTFPNLSITIILETVQL